MPGKNLNSSLSGINVSARVDIRDLAAIATFFWAQQEPARSRSDLINRALSTFADALETEGLTVVPDTAQKAVQNLNDMGLRFMESDSNRNVTELNISRESLTGVEDEAREAERLIEQAARRNPTKDEVESKQAEEKEG